MGQYNNGVFCDGLKQGRFDQCALTECNINRLLAQKQIIGQNKQPSLQYIQTMHSLYSTKSPTYEQSTIIEPYPYDQPTFRSTRVQSYGYQQPYQSTIRYPSDNKQSSYSFCMEKNQNKGYRYGCEGKTNMGDFSKCSSVSAGSLPKSDEIDCARQLAQLEQKLTQQILILRQQKLTLMEQQNIATENRYKMQRQLNKLKKKSLQSETASNQTAEEDTITKLYKQQLRRRKQLQARQEEGQSVQYQNLTSEECEIMEKILNLKQTNNQLMIELYKGDVGDCQLNKKQGKQTTPLQANSYLQSLHAKKQKLLTKLLTQTGHQNLIANVLTLLHTNQQLQMTIDKYIYREKHRLALLREKVKQEQENKKNMLEEIIKMKSQLKSLKLENQEFRKAMIYFRF